MTLTCHFDTYSLLMAYTINLKVFINIIPPFIGQVVWLLFLSLSFYLKYGTTFILESTLVSGLPKSKETSRIQNLSHVCSPEFSSSLYLLVNLSYIFPLFTYLFYSINLYLFLLTKMSLWPIWPLVKWTTTVECVYVLTPISQDTLTL